ncbi:hypothetical protein V5O48_007066 [Marasmius crinis-equi]|uniref:F-box domain-containing protein n=1 Tax=Marasmius crinis-equi TaxID=585013 RepID=A0ABR3FHP8_9AGAR
MDRETSLSNTIYRLPHDVLAIIFHFFAYSYTPERHRIWHKDIEDAEYEYEMAHARHRPPWNLGKVCRTWRTSVLSLPHLWTNFDFKTCMPYDYLVYTGDTEMLSAQLERCNGQPIHLRLGALPEDADSSISYNILSAVLTTSTRVASLSLIPESSMFDCLESYFMARPFPDLQEINLDVNDRLKPFVASRLAPNLRTLNVWGADPELLEAPWGHITRYTSRDSKTYYVENHFHYYILPRLENLQTCWLDCVVLNNNQRTGALSPPIILPYLHTLILSSAAPIGSDRYAAPGITQLFDSITLPALDTLKFWNSTRQSSQSLIQFICRSGCSLRELTIYRILLEDEDDVFNLVTSGLLKYLKSLSLGLGLDLSPRGVSVLDALARDPTGPKDYLPQLRCFETDCWDTRPEELADIVRSRRSSDGNGQILERLILQDRATVAEYSRSGVMSSFEELRVGGLIVEWKLRRFRGL